MSAACGLVVRDLQMRRGQRTVVQLPRLDLSPGQALALMGRNGSGKSTLLRGIAGVLPVARGTIRFAGQDLTGLSPARRARLVSCLFQRHRVAFDFTLAELVALGLSAPDPQRVATALARVGLSTLGHRRWSRCSGGEQQRAHIARALVAGAGLLLLDEPDNHLDLGGRAQLQALIDEERQRGACVVLATHDLDLATSCDRLLLLDGGAPRTLGHPARVVSSPGFLAAFGLAHLPDHRVRLHPPALGPHPWSTT